MAITDHAYHLDRFTIPQNIEYLFQGLLPRRGVGILLGKSQAGKSLFSLRLAASLATGAPVVMHPDHPEFGQPMLRGATLYFCGEGEWGLTGRLLAAEEALGPYKYQLPKHHPYLPIITLGIGHKKLHGAEQINDLKVYISQHKEWLDRQGCPIRLIIVDTLVSCMAIDNDSDNGEMQEIHDALKRFGIEFDCFLMAVAHPPKRRGIGEELAVRGASTAGNSPDVIMKLEKSGSGNLRKLTLTKVRDGKYNGIVCNLRLQTFSDLPAMVPDNSVPQTKEELTREITPQSEEMQKHILDAIKTSEKGWLSKKALRDLLVPKNVPEISSGGIEPPKRNTLLTDLNRNLKRLVAVGKITQDESGHYSLASSVATTQAIDVVEAAPKDAANQEAESKRIAAEKIFGPINIIPPPPPST